MNRVVAGTWLLLAVYAQQPPEPRFRVGVDVVRLDAVVTDRDGRIVSDLTAADFDVRQDGKRQDVTYAQFIPVVTGPIADPVASLARDGTALPPPPLKREDVQRTFALVVDDLGLSVESVQGTRRALHAFVDRELRPADLVALVRTGGSTGALQSFTTDRRVLHAAIDGLRWNGASRNGVEPFEPINKFFVSGGGGPPGGSTTAMDPTDFSTVTRLRNSMASAGSLGALNLVVHGVRDLPGRKTIIFVSEGFELLKSDTGAGVWKQPDSRVRAALDHVVDQATRAGVVIYSLDCRGLQTGGLTAADNLKVGGLEPDAMDSLVRDQGRDRLAFNRDTQEGMAYLAEQTGGFAVLNANDLARGLGRITDDVRGYYVIGYVPKDGTFAGKGQQPSLHKIAIAAVRPGLRVRSRKAFLGVSDPAENATALSPAQELVRTATSPFTTSALSLRATTLPAYSPADGAFVRALLHVDARGLTFADGEAGKKTAAADVLGMVFDQDGVEVAHLSTGFSVALADKAADEALRDGIAYTLRIPIPRPGGYQVRFAVRDRRSGALGSAGEFVDMADMPGGEFALSGIVLRTDEGRGAAAPSGLERLALTPEQALRVFPSGSRLSYAYEIYNALGTVQAAPSIWRGTEPVFTAAPDTLTVPAGGSARFAAAGGLKLSALAPGPYVLQISAATNDARRPGRSRIATQRIAFDVK